MDKYGYVLVNMAMFRFVWVYRAIFGFVWVYDYPIWLGSTKPDTFS